MLNTLFSETIITSCQKQWGEDSIDLQKLISDHIINDKDRRPHISHVHEMIPLITALCARRTIDWEFSVGKNKEQLLHIFASAIATVVCLR